MADDNSSRQATEKAADSKHEELDNPAKYLKADFWKSGQRVSGFQPTCPSVAQNYDDQYILQDYLEDVPLDIEEEIDEPPDDWAFPTLEDVVIAGAGISKVPSASNGTSNKLPWAFDDREVVFVGSSSNEDDETCSEEENTTSPSLASSNGRLRPRVDKLKRVAEVGPRAGHVLVTGICAAGKGITTVCTGPIRGTTMLAGQVGSYLGEKALETGQIVATAAKNRLPEIADSLRDGAGMAGGMIMEGLRSLPPSEQGVMDRHRRV